MSLRMLCAAAAATTIVACAMGGAPTSMAPSTAAAPAPAPELPQPNSPQDDQIASLSRDIESARGTMGLPAPAPGAGRTGAMPMTSDVKPSVAPIGPVEPTQATCHPASDTCSQTCTLSESICGNAKKICEIANELPGDAWASNKCVEGNETCVAAKKRCCDCAP
ncbi:MAG: hypothetical protein ABJE66_09565 [Deltaproteobacteria bacterium]